MLTILIVPPFATVLGESNVTVRGRARFVVKLAIFTELVPVFVVDFRHGLSDSFSYIGLEKKKSEIKSFFGPPDSYNIRFYGQLNVSNR